MMQSNLDLLKNSISFFQEAVRYAGRSSTDPTQWKFAIINLVQSMELALKEALRRIHPAFIYDDLDSPDAEKTISITKAIARLRNEIIGNISITDGEVQNFKTAIKLRNHLVHHDGSYHPEHAEAKFANIFAFMLFFLEKHLEAPRNSIISSNQYSEILSLKKTKKELLIKVQEIIAQQDIDNIWMCTDCLEDTFIVEEEACRLCGHQEEVISCDNCGREILEFELKDVWELFDSSFEEGRLEIYNRYGYEHDHACVHCIGEVRETIKDRRFAEYCEEMEAEAFYLSSRE